jgi:hypothetical protein
MLYEGMPVSFAIAEITPELQDFAAWKVAKSYPGRRARGGGFSPTLSPAPTS